MDAIDLFSKYLSKNDCSMNENLKTVYYQLVICFIPDGVYI